MDELLRVEKCLNILREAPLAPAKPVSYSEFLRQLRQFRVEVDGQLNGVKAFNHRARKLKAAMLHEIPNIVRLCHESPVGFFASTPDLISSQASVPATPVTGGGTPQPFRKTRPALDSHAGSGNTPKSQTSISTSRFLLQNKFSARCSSKLCSQTPKNAGSRLTKQLEMLDSTPQMPNRTLQLKRSAIKKLANLRGPQLSQLGQSTQLTQPEKALPPAVPREAASTLPVTTPLMKERVSFFTNPNVANIHKRYVAMQDLDADESTCLLSSNSRHLPSKSCCTPEMPPSCQKKTKNATPFRTASITPPLPFSSTKKPPAPATPPRRTPNSEKKRAMSRTPSPPRAKANKSRTCLETRIKSFVAQTPVLISRPSRAQNGDLAANCNNVTNVLRELVLNENLNSMRKKKLLTSIAETPAAPKKDGSKSAALKPHVAVARSTSLRSTLENTSVQSRPSKMLRSKTVAI